MYLKLHWDNKHQQTRLNDHSSKSMSNSWPVFVVEPFFWTSQLLDNFWLKDLAKFHGSIFNADPQAPGHVMLFRCIRELKGIYNV